MDDKLQLAIKEFQEGNNDAFTVIYELLYNKVYFIASQHAKGQQNIEDIVQDSFVSIYRSLPDLGDIEFFNAWLNKVVYSFFIKSVRSKQMTERVDMGENYDFDRFVPSNPADNPQELYYKGELKEQIDYALESLPVEQREVARMRFYDELSIKEISEILDIPQGTVKSRLSKIREAITPYLSEYKNMMGVIIFPLLYQYFREVINLGNPVQNVDIAMNCQVIAMLAGGSIPFNQGNAQVRPNIATYFMAGTAVALPAIMTAVNLSNNAKLPTVNNLVYDSSWTNETVSIEIDGSLNLADENTKVMLNGKAINPISTRKGYVVNVHENGNLEILYKNELIYTEKIKNIDKELPGITLNENDENIILDITDEHSGLIIDSVTVVDQNGKSIPYVIVDNKVQFSKNDDYTEITITVEDNANNKNVGKITVKEVTVTP